MKIHEYQAKELFSNAGIAIQGGRLAVTADEAEKAMAAAVPINDMRGTIRQRVHLVGVLTRRTLNNAIHRARGG